MKILFFSQYYSPETNAPAHRMSFFAKYIAKKEEVSVVCEPPNYPKGEIFDGYKNKFRYIENKDGVKVIRSWVYITKKKNFIHRILNYASFTFSSFINGMRAEKPDIILATSPPFSGMASAWLVSKLRRVPLILDIRDIWPDSAVSVGMMSKGKLFNFLQWWEKKFYKKAKKIIVNANGIGERLVKEKGVNSEKIEFLPNGSEIDIFDLNDNGEEINKKYNLDNKFVVLFTGLIGLAQDPEVIIKSANLLKDKENIIFLIVGDGPKREPCLDLIKELNLKNVIMTGSKPRSEMPKFCARANVCLATHKEDKLFSDVISSKIFDYMGAAKPIVINSEGEGSRIIEEADAGLKADIASPESLTEKILFFYNNNEISKEKGLNGRVYAEEHFDKKKIAEKLQLLLKDNIL
jgi:glycosyltransferase involved in cell wall biosynthesis